MVMCKQLIEIFIEKGVLKMNGDGVLHAEIKEKCEEFIIEEQEDQISITGSFVSIRVNKDDFFQALADNSRIKREVKEYCQKRKHTKRQ